MDISDAGLLALFEQVAPAEGWGALARGRSSPQIYSLPVVVGMMLAQRLDARGTQEVVVQELLNGRLMHLLPDSKRVREGKISGATGGYAQACERTPVETLRRVCDAVLEDLGQRMEADIGMPAPVLLLDGTSLQTESRKDLVEAFPPSRNQHGLSHWGMLRLVALHDMRTGIALRPAWGPMYGPEAVSEQALAEQVLAQAPAGSVIVGDRNFGVFSCAWATARNHQQVLFRLTRTRARSLGASKLGECGEMPLCWRPSAWDRKHHPELPAEAAIDGRLIVARCDGLRSPLYLFTTLPGEAGQIAGLYARRWELELDLRTLKRTMRLDQLRGKSRAAVEKEILIAVIAYGLVRAFMAAAARRAHLRPRQLRFTACYELLNRMADRLCTGDPVQREQAFDDILNRMAQYKLPRRTRPRAYPRVVWPRKQPYPMRRTTPSPPKIK